jgi:hypothetical protein
MRLYLSVLFLFLFFQISFQLNAGNGVFQFLDLPVSSRMAAIGGKNVSLTESDISFALVNPALLNKTADNMIGLNMSNYLADIQFGTAVYGKSYGKNMFALGVQYVDYGTFKETTEYNEILGEFTATDISLNLIYSRILTDKISVGITLKPVYSSFYNLYTSFGAAVDLGVSYKNPDKYFSAGLVLRNMGTQFKGYYADAAGQHFEALPFDIALGMTKKLAHAPLRFSVTLHNLQTWDMSYIDNNESLYEYEVTDMIPEIEFIDMCFRHTIFGVEFMPGKNFYLAASYNHRRTKELTMNGFKSLAGFAFGGGLKISKFQVGFSMTQFQVGTYSYQFSVSTSLNEFKP